jgi:hypothetical protein
MSVPTVESTILNAECPNTEYSSDPGVQVNKLIRRLQLSTEAVACIIENSNAKTDKRCLTFFMKQVYRL